jgi:hypothetical protein
MTVPIYAESETFRSNENVDILIGLASSLTNPSAPDLNELNDTDLFRNIVGIAPFSDMTFPAATASSDSDDGPVVNQAAGVTRPGTGAYQGDAIGTYLQAALKDHSSTQGWLLNILNSIKYDKKGIAVYVVTRIAQSPENAREPFKAGDWVSVFRFRIVASNNLTSGGAAYREIGQFLSDGEMHINTFAIDGTTKVPIVISGATAGKVGQFVQLRAKAYGHDVTTLVNWASPDSSVAVMDQTGLVYLNGAGSAELSATHAALGDGSTTITVTAPDAATVTSTALTVPAAGGVVKVEGTNLDSLSRVSLNGETIYDWEAAAGSANIYIPATEAASYSLLLTTVDGTDIPVPLTVS